MKKSFRQVISRTLLFSVLILTGITVSHNTVSAATTMHQNAVNLKIGDTRTLSSSGVLSVNADRIMTLANSRMNYIFTNKFHYGDAKKNPAFDDSERLVSCDRFVQWVLYDLGYTDLPAENGLVVYNEIDPSKDMTRWLNAHGAVKITSASAVQAGDLVFLGNNNRPAHVYILGKSRENGLWERYDCGNEARINRTGQFAAYPFVEPVEYSNNPFVYAYRLPTINLTWKSSNSQIASVSDTGVITGLKEGFCTITGSNGSQQVSYTVTVSSDGIPKVSSVSKLPAKYTGYAVIAGKTCYIKNRKKYTGILKISGTRYYLKKGVKLTGYRKIRKKKYYYKNGRIYTGFLKIKGKKYYLQKGKKLTGYRKIKGKRYYYRSGRLYTGYRTKNGKRVYYRKGRKVV